MQYQPGHYLAFELSEKCRADLLRTFKPSFSKVICHHVTIEFNLTPDKLQSFVKLLDSAPKVEAFAIAHGDGIECLGVRIGGQTERADGSFYHVTLSLEPPHKPVESNKLQDLLERWRGPAIQLEGAFKLLRK